MALVFGYLTHQRRGPGAGMRAHDDGQVELQLRDGRWRPITTLDEDALDELREAVRASGVLKLPEHTPRPPNIHDGDSCELWSDVDGGVHAVIEAWTDTNPAALPSRDLTGTLSRLVTAAQARA